MASTKTRLLKHDFPVHGKSQNWNRYDIENCSDLKPQSATKIASESVEMTAEIATDIAVIRIAANSNCQQVGFEIASDFGIYAPIALGDLVVIISSRSSFCTFVWNECLNMSTTCRESQKHLLPSLARKTQ